jgi:hypothetical protein
VSGSPAVATHPRLTDTPAPDADAEARLRASNRRTALTLASIAVVFFVGIIASRFMGGYTTGVGVVGAAVLLYLVVAIGRNLRSKQ